MIGSNDDCILVKPDETMLDEIASYRAAFLLAGDSMDGTGPLRKMDDPLEWVELCRAFGLDRVLITCLVENEASRRTILSCGGVYDKTVYCERDNVNLERYWISLT